MSKTYCRGTALCIAIAAICLLALGTRAQKSTATFHILPHLNERSLKGVGRIGLTVNPIVFVNATVSVDEARILATTAQLQLRLAGVPFQERPWNDEGVPFEKSHHPRFTKKDMPTLVVQKTSISTDEYNVEAYVVETAALLRDPHMTATVTTWMGSASLKPFAEGKDRLADATKEVIDEFCNAYLSANPK